MSSGISCPASACSTRRACTGCCSPGPSLVFLIGAGLTVAVRYVDAQPEAARWAGWIGLGIMAIGFLWASSTGWSSAPASSR